MTIRELIEKGANLDDEIIIVPNCYNSTTGELLEDMIDNIENEVDSVSGQIAFNLYIWLNDINE